MRLAPSSSARVPATLVNPVRALFEFSDPASATNALAPSSVSDDPFAMLAICPEANCTTPAPETLTVPLRTPVVPKPAAPPTFSRALADAVAPPWRLIVPGLARPAVVTVSDVVIELLPILRAPLFVSTPAIARLDPPWPPKAPDGLWSRSIAPEIANAPEVATFAPSPSARVPATLFNPFSALFEVSEPASAINAWGPSRVIVEACAMLVICPDANSMTPPSETFTVPLSTAAEPNPAAALILSRPVCPARTSPAMFIVPLLTRPAAVTVSPSVI